jgi:hypothetical protein
MFAALHCETIGLARVRFSICIRVVASTQIRTRPVVMAQTDLDEDLITLLDRTARHPFQSHEP